MQPNNKFPSREEAEKIVTWAYEQNPQPWAEHCRTVARAAETIAQKCGLDAYRAYILGLFHDIGYHEYRSGKGRTCHIYIGYEFMMKKGYKDIAKICISHSFPYKDIKAYGGSDMNCNDEELAFINSFLAETEYDDYDKLIQLCDCMAGAQIVTLEKRILSVIMRHGFSSPALIKKYETWFEIKDYFDKLCGINIYNLFYDEIKNSIFRG